MAKATREIKERLKGVDMVLEIRDARIPFSSGNYLLEELFTNKKRMIALNKSDLANPRLCQSAEDAFARRNQLAYSVTAHNEDSVKNLLQGIHEWVRKECNKKDALVLMVVGVPNCGKSSLINAMHKAAKVMLIEDLGQTFKSNPAKIGPNPGVTRHMSSFRIGARPSMYVMDTPGVMVPRIADLETGLKLALTGAVKDSVVGEVQIAMYLLAMFNWHPDGLKIAAAQELRNLRKSVEKGGFQRRFAGPASKLAELMPRRTVPAEELGMVFDEVLDKLANRSAKGDKNDISESSRLIASQTLIRHYRQGKLGQFTWDRVGDCEVDDGIGAEADSHDCLQQDSGRVAQTQLYPRASKSV